MPCSSTLMATVITVTVRISFPCGTADSSRINNTNRIEASPRGPIQPRNSFVGIFKHAPNNEKEHKDQRCSQPKYSAIGPTLLNKSIIQPRR